MSEFTLKCVVQAPTTIAKALLDIFKFIGPPAILQPDTRREFSGIAKKKLGEEEVAEVAVAHVTASDVVVVSDASINIVDVFGGADVVVSSKVVVALALANLAAAFQCY